ncbi:hypothetical protein D9756_003586 [Leucocoprinus leucothites]|uniref:Nephrocystin 3-like N-terminal domain-containing protein n=1 Tax=Leucocoprinus leucothites TaxID=201217 RepID=A0A8H5G7E3_9AGAR|nr:hypothetical protein D9756_003586 [Leucoagaricus leucothites]
MPQKFFSSSSIDTAVDDRYPVDLPRDIWDAIAEFVPDRDIKRLYSITPAFLYRALKLRYQFLQVTKWADLSTCRTLEHARTPFCAAFVRHLGVQFEGLQQHNIQNRPGISAMNLPPSTVLLGKTQRYAQYSVSFISSFLSQRLTPSFELTMALLLEAIPHLRHVNTFSVNCWDLPPGLDVSTVLIAAWSSFGSNITTFIFNGNIDSYQFLSESKPYLPNLTSLELDTTLNMSRTVRDIEHERQVLRDYVAPLVSSLAPQLLSFQLFFFPNADLSELFNLISRTKFGKLKYLRLRMPYNRSYQDPSGLLAFLSPLTLPVLEDLNLRLNPTGATLDRSNEIPLAEFLTALTNYTPVTFTNLRMLELFPTHLQEGRDALYTAIARSSDTLKSVCVRDRSLQPDEFVELVRVLVQCKELKMLRLNLSKLDIGVIDLLASSFPKLNRLTIAIDESRNLEEPSISSTLEADLATRDYSSWELRDIGFYRAGSQVDRNLMEVFARHIPSISSFWAQLVMLVQVFQQQFEVNGHHAVQKHFSKSFALTINPNDLLNHRGGTISAVNTREPSSFVAHVRGQAVHYHAYTPNDTDIAVKYKFNGYQSQAHYISVDELDLLSRLCIPGSEIDSPFREPIPHCHPNTRLGLLNRILTWATTANREDPHVFWLSGSAGMGKSAVSQTAAEALKTLRVLGATFFFSQGDYQSPAPDNQIMSPTRIIATVAYQLALSFPEYGRVVADALSKDPTILEKSLALQFKALLVDPFWTIMIEGRTVRKPLVVVLDGLDEYPDPKIQCELVRLIGLHSHLDGFPLKWLVSSRSEWYLESTFFHPALPIKCVHEDLHHLGRGDIEIYLKDGLQQISRLYPGTIDDIMGVEIWPTVEDTYRLIKAAGDLFTIAVSILDFLRNPSSPPISEEIPSHPHHRLQFLLSNIDNPSTFSFPHHPFKQVHSRYTSSLSRLTFQSLRLSGGSISPGPLTGTTKVLSLLLQIFKLWTTQPTLTPFELCNLLSLSRRAFYYVLRHVHGLVRCSSALSDKYNRKFLRGVQPAFLDFITNPPDEIVMSSSLGVSHDGSISSAISKSLFRLLLRPRLHFSIHGLSWKSQPPHGFDPQSLAIEDLIVSHQIVTTAIRLSWQFCSSISLRKMGQIEQISVV